MNEKYFSKQCQIENHKAPTRTWNGKQGPTQRRSLKRAVPIYTIRNRLIYSIPILNIKNQQLSN